MVAQVEAEAGSGGTDRGVGDVSRSGRRWYGFALGLLGVATYTVGLFLPFFSPSQPGAVGFGTSSAFATYVQHAFNVSTRAAEAGLLTLLFCGPVVVLVMCVGGLVGRRPVRWAIGLSAAAAAWLVHATGWMNDLNFDSPRLHAFLGHAVGYEVMTLGAVIALIGGVVAFAANRPRDRGRDPAAAARGRRLARVGLAVGLAGAVVYLISTFLRYGGPSQSSFPGSPGSGHSIVQIDVCCAFGVFPFVNQAAAAIALWGPALVVLAVSVVGLSRRDPAPWAFGLTAAATTWPLRTVGDTVLGYIGTPYNGVTGIGYLGMQLGIVVAFVGGLVALAGGLVRGSETTESFEPSAPLPA